jgi:hypothetical protein
MTALFPRNSWYEDCLYYCMKKRKEDFEMGDDPFISTDEMNEFNRLLGWVVEDTLSCWVSTRVNGASASLACDGNISIPLIRAMDKYLEDHIDNN